MKEFSICIGIALVAVAVLFALGYAVGMFLVGISQLIGSSGAVLALCIIVAVFWVARLIWLTRGNE